MDQVEKETFLEVVIVRRKNDAIKTVEVAIENFCGVVLKIFFFMKIVTRGI